MDDSQLTSPTEVPRRRWLRFSLRFLLFAVLLVSVLFGAFNWGQRVGYEDGYRAGKNLLLGETIRKVYRVADLVAGSPNGGGRNADFEPLLKQIKNNVAQGTWDGSDSWIQCYKTDPKIVVSQKPAVHDMLEEFFDQLRKKPATQKTR